MVAVSCIIGITVPQVAEKGPRFFETWKAENPSLYVAVNLLQLNRVYTSIWFLALTSIIAVSLSLTVWDQGAAALRTLRYRKRPVSPDGFKNFKELIVSGPIDLTRTVETVKAVLKAKGFRVSHEDINEPASLIFNKNSGGKLGGFILHTGFLCVVLAGLYSLACHQRGFIQLIGTDTFSGKNADWLTSDHGLLAKDFDLGFKVHLKRFVPDYWENDRVKSLKSELIIKDHKVEKNVILGVNSPVRHRGVTIYQSTHYGYTVTFVLTRPTGEPVVTHFSLDAPSWKDRPFVGKTDFPTADYVLDMKFHPNLKEPSFFLAFPGVDLTVTEKENVMFKGRVLFNQRAWIGDDALQFTGVHYWSGIAFVKNSGTSLIYFGFMIISFGAFLIYFLIPREIHIQIERQEDGAILKVGGRSRKYQALFADEFEKICQDIMAGSR